jgi:hypothetical protein
MGLSAVFMRINAAGNARDTIAERRCRVPTGNQKWLTSFRESVDSRDDGRALRVHLMRYSRLFRSRAAWQAEILVLRHQLNILRRRSPKRVALGKIDRLVFCGLYRLSPTMLAALRILKPETIIRWHRAWFPSLLALEITTARRPAKDPRGHSPPHSRDERCQPLVGSATDSWRTAQARDRRRPDDGCKIHGQEKAAAFAKLEDLPSQSCRPYRIDRSVCRPRDFVSAIVRTSDLAAFAAGAFVVGRNGTSKCRMDCPSIDRGLRVQ